MAGLSTLSIITLNVRGIATASKRTKIFNLLPLLNAEIYLIQETNLSGNSLINKAKSEWPGLSFWANGDFKAGSGVAVLVKPGLDIDINLVFDHPSGRLMVVDVDYLGLQARVINIYYPAKPSKLENFTKILNAQVLTKKNIILAGDFNFVENHKLDKKGSVYNINKKYIEQFRELTAVANLNDAFRFLYPKDIVYSFRCRIWGTLERLDRFYVGPVILPRVSQVKHLSTVFTDHNAVRLDLRLDKSPPKKSTLWKCNIEVLDDPHFRDDFTFLCDCLEDSYGPNPTVDSWESFKRQTKSLVINHAARLNAIRRAEIDDIAYKIRNLSIEDEANEVEAAIQTYLDKIKEGAKIRSKTMDLDNSEKPTSYFFAKEKKHNKKQFIKKLKVDNKVVEDPDEIVEACHDYFSELLSPKPIDESLWDSFFKDCPSLTEEEAELCEGAITYDECYKAIRGMADGKSPGSDGFPAEFYKKLFPLFGFFFIKIINSGINQLSLSQRIGVISLLSKNPENADLLSNWRPITLLNVDYKIISKSITNRIKKVANSLIQPDQTCGLAGRSIFDNLHNIRNIVDYCKERNINCLAVSLDQAKAFDSVDHRFLIETLKRFGFGPTLIMWVTLLYSNIFSCIKVNGTFTKLFAIGRSVRQGCSLSPILYALCIENLANIIRNNPSIHGIRLPASPPQEFKISLYADDTNLFLHDEKSVEAAVEAFDLFSKVSGASLNRDKCQACVMAGKVDTGRLPPWLTLATSLKILGIFFGLRANEENEKALKKKIENKISLHQSRYLTLKGRSVIINGLICPSLWHVFTVTLPSKEFLMWLNRKVYYFIWHGIDRINRPTMCLPDKLGGIGLIDVGLQLQAIRIRHIVDLILKADKPWRTTAAYWLGLRLSKFNNSLNNNSIPRAFQASSYYTVAYDNFKTYHMHFKDADLSKVSVHKCYVALCKKKNIQPRIVRVSPELDRPRFWANIIKIPLSPEPRRTLWLLSHDVLRTCEWLWRHHIIASPLCILCKTCIETLEHLFYNCELSSHAKKLATDCLSDPCSLHRRTSIELAFFDPAKPVSVADIIIIAEYFKCIYNCRVLAGKDRVKYTKERVANLLRGNLRLRIKTDRHRWPTDRFYVVWGSSPALVALDIL